MALLARARAFPLRRARVASVVALAALAAWTLTATSAAADPTPADKETARRLMSEGRAHRHDGDHKGALQSFLAADAIMHVPTTGLEVARTEIDLGQLVEAKDALLAVSRLPDAENEPRAFTEARETAKTLSAEIEPRIPSLALKVVGAPPSATPNVTVDGVAIPALALAVPRAVDPGHHVVAARLGDAERAVRVEVDVKEGETKEVALDVATEAAIAPVKPKASEETSPLRTASYVSLGVGGVGIVVGAVTGVLAITNLSSAKNGCAGDECPPSADPQISKASTMATVSTVAFVVGGVGVAGGVVGFVLSRPPSTAAGAATASSTRLPFTLGLSLGPGSMALRGTF